MTISAVVLVFLLFYSQFNVALCNCPLKLDPKKAPKNGYIRIVDGTTAVVGCQPGYTFRNEVSYDQKIGMFRPDGGVNGIKYKHQIPGR